MTSCSSASAMRDSRMASPAPRPRRSSRYDDGADLGEVRAVEMERAAAEEVVFEDAGLGVGDGAVGDGEVADVLADLGVGAAEEGAVVGEGVDEVEDVAGVLQARLVNADVRSAGRERLVRGEIESDEVARQVLFLWPPRETRCEMRDSRYGCGRRRGLRGRGGLRCRRGRRGSRAWSAG